MKKIFFAVLLLYPVVFIYADDSKKMTDEELIAKIMQLDKREQDADKKIAEAKAKTKALEKLEETVDELAKTLQVEK